MKKSCLKLFREDSKYFSFLNQAGIIENEEYYSFIKSSCGKMLECQINNEMEKVSKKIYKDYVKSLGLK